MDTLVITPPPASAPHSSGFLEFVTGLLTNPATSIVAPAIFSALGVAAPPIVPLLLKFGLPAIGSVLATWTGDTITDEQIETELATKGHKVVPFDPSKLWGAGQ